MTKKTSKYRAKKVIVDGIEFHSKKEANRYSELKILERAGEIENLQLQVPFVIIPAQYQEETVITKRGKEKIQKKLVERKTTYVADFVYTKDGEMIVEDVKGYRMAGAYSIFVIKRKLMLQVHGIRVSEV